MKHLALATLALTAASAHAATIISVSAPNSSGSIGAPVTSASWTETASYANVSIDVVVSNQSTTGETISVQAFLTNSRGPGTTVANQIAATSFIVNPGLDQNLNIFSGLSLGPGTHFLFLSLDGGGSSIGGWAAALPTVVLDAGVTHSNTDLIAVAPAPFPPASSFTDLISADRVLFSVYTTPGTAVPEPSTAGLLGIGLAAALWRTSRRR